MIVYAGLVVAVIAVLVYFWLQRRVKAAIVQPIGGNNVLLPALLSEKKRIAAIREKYDLVFGLVIGAGSVLLCWMVGR